MYAVDRDDRDGYNTEHARKIIPVVSSPERRVKVQEKALNNKIERVGENDVVRDDLHQPDSTLDSKQL